MTPKPPKEVLAEMDLGDALRGPAEERTEEEMTLLRQASDSVSVNTAQPITKSLLLSFNGALRHESYGPPVKIVCTREDSGRLAKHASDCASPYTERNYLHYMP